MTTTHSSVPPAVLDPTDDASCKTLKRQAIRGSLWTIIGFVATQTMRLGNTAVLAWVLGPTILGIMSIVRVLTQGLDMCSDLGIGPSIIQNKSGNDPAFLNTAWTIQIIRGTILWGACFLLAIPIGLVYEEPLYYVLVPIVGFSMVITGFTSTSLFTLNRRMTIGKLKIIELVVQFATFATMIGAAVLTGSIWGIVIGWLVGSTTRLVISHAVNDVTPHRFQWDSGARQELYSFGKWIFLSTVIAFVAGQLDRPILGKLVEMKDLGIYHVAMVVAILPQQIAGQLCTFVLFPVLANRVRERREKFCADLLRARRAIMPLGLLAALGIAVVAPLFFRLLFKPQFHPAGTIVQISMIPMWFTILQTTADRAPLALGDSKSLMFSNAIRFVASTTGCIIGFYTYKVEGFVVGLSAGTLLGHVAIQVALARHGIRIFRQDVFWTVAFTVLSALGIVLPLWVVHRFEVGIDPMLFCLAVGLVVLTMTGIWSVGCVRDAILNRKSP